MQDGDWWGANVTHRYSQPAAAPTYIKMLPAIEQQVVLPRQWQRPPKQTSDLAVRNSPCLPPAAARAGQRGLTKPLCQRSKSYLSTCRQLMEKTQQDDFKKYPAHYLLFAAVFAPHPFGFIKLQGGIPSPAMQADILRDAWCQQKPQFNKLLTEDLTRDSQTHVIPI